MKISLSRTLLHAGLLFCLFAEQALAAGGTYEITVQAGKHDRANTPVSVLIVEPEQQANLNPVILGKARSVTVTDAEGNNLPAQLTMPGLLNASQAANGRVVREIHFIASKLKQGESLKLKAVVSPEKPAGGFAWTKTPGEFAELSYGDRPVLRYMCQTLTDENREDAFKVYHHVYDPAGTRWVTKGPGGLYTHHRGLFFGYCNVTYGDGKQKADTWSGRNTPETHGGFLAEEAGPVLGRHRLAVDWRGSDGQVYLKEQRELTVYNTPGGHLIEFASRLSATAGKVTLDGNAPHAGFQFRADQEVAAENQKLTYYLRPDGKGEMGQARAKAMDLPWDALSFVLGEKRYTVVYLDRPDNPKPAEYNERAYGRFGSFFRYELDQRKDLEVNYRIWLQDGEMTVAQAAALHADFVEPIGVVAR